MTNATQRKRNERARVLAEFGAKPATLLLRPHERRAVLDFVERRFGHRGTVTSLRAADTKAVAQHAAKGTCDLKEQLTLGIP